MKTYQFFACALAAAAVLTGCNKNEETGVQSVTLDQTTLTVEVGQTAQLTATVTPEGAADTSLYEQHGQLKKQLDDAMWQWSEASETLEHLQKQGK